ncbi:1121_t:CDS:2, partial [Gigaspora margarita]
FRCHEQSHAQTNNNRENFTVIIPVLEKVLNKSWSRDPCHFLSIKSCEKSKGLDTLQYVRKYYEDLYEKEEIDIQW